MTPAYPAPGQILSAALEYLLKALLYLFGYTAVAVVWVALSVAGAFAIVFMIVSWPVLRVAVPIVNRWFR